MKLIHCVMNPTHDVIQSYNSIHKFLISKICDLLVVNYCQCTQKSIIRLKSMCFSVYSLTYSKITELKRKFRTN